MVQDVAEHLTKAVVVEVTHCDAKLCFSQFCEVHCAFVHQLLITDACHVSTASTIQPPQWSFVHQVCIQAFSCTCVTTKCVDFPPFTEFWWSRIMSQQ